MCTKKASYLKFRRLATYWYRNIVEKYRIVKKVFHKKKDIIIGFPVIYFNFSRCFYVDFYDFRFYDWFDIHIYYWWVIKVIYLIVQRNIKNLNFRERWKTFTMFRKWQKTEGGRVNNVNQLNYFYIWYRNQI